MSGHADSDGMSGHADSDKVCHRWVLLPQLNDCKLEHADTVTVTKCAIGVYHYPSLVTVNSIMLTVTECAIGV